VPGNVTGIGGTLPRNGVFRGVLRGHMQDSHRITGVASEKAQVFL